MGSIEAAAALAASFSVLFPVLGMLGRYHWALDILAHFRLQYFGCLLLCSAAFGVMRKGRAALFSLAAAVMLAAPLWRFYSPMTAAGSHPPSLKVISFNVNTSNRQYSEVASFLLDQNADLIFLMEVNRDWLTGLRALEATYPSRIEQPRSDNFGVVLYSRHPFTDQEILSFADDGGIPAVSCSMQAGFGKVRFLCMHTLPPSGGERAAWRDEELADMARRAAAMKNENVVMMGDFNLTPFSVHFGNLLRESGLNDSATGWGITPTWMRNSVIFAIPIDHVLISPRLRVVSRHTADALGSDHNPLIVELAKTEDPQH